MPMVEAIQIYGQTTERNDTLAPVKPALMLYFSAWIQTSMKQTYAQN